MSLPKYAMDAARRIAARSGAPVDAVISAYRAAANGKAVNAASLFFGRVGVITPRRTRDSKRNKSGAYLCVRVGRKNGLDVFEDIPPAKRTRDSKRNREAVAV